MKWLTYYLDFVTVPVAAAAFALHSPPDSWLWWDFFVAGWFSWTMMEYVIHRSILHRVLRRTHWLHHLNPVSTDGSAPTLIVHAVAIVLLFLSVVLLGDRFGLAYMTGISVGYWLFTVVHHGIHRGWFSPFGIIGGVVRRHELHHNGVEMNFNFLLPIGDHLFNTYKDVPYSTYVAREWRRLNGED